MWATEEPEDLQWNDITKGEEEKRLKENMKPGADPGFVTRGGGCPNLGGLGHAPQENFEKFTPLKGNFKAFQVICSYKHLYLSC